MDSGARRSLGIFFFFLAALAFYLVALATMPVSAQARSYGIAGQKAPSLGVTQWINLPEGKEILDIPDFKGKVLYLYCFQSWCPGCHSHGFPTLQRMIKKYEHAGDVAFAAVQTVFEGYSSNRAKRAWETAEQYGLKIPVGHDGSEENRSVLMQRFRTGGTPWTILIDKKGVVRFNGFRLSFEEAMIRVDALRKETTAVSEERAIRTLPASRGGQDVIGKNFTELSFDRWLNCETRPGDGKTGSVRLYRWWTDTCPYCEASLPALEGLSKKYEKRGLEVIAAYHPKPPRPVEDRTILQAARSFGFTGSIAVDIDWSELERAYLDRGKRSATSVSILVDKDGKIRFVHPGPVFFPSKNPKYARQNEDFELLEATVQALLPMPGA
ncbi:MAG: peroxiredoxin family protein [Planctomycetota bacterium]|jgi:thiol-disulfide isomerase/thioredoxin